MAPLELAAQLPHCLVWPYWHYQLVLSWYLHQPELHQLTIMNHHERTDQRIIHCIQVKQLMQLNKQFKQTHVYHATYTNHMTHATYIYKL